MKKLFFILVLLCLQFKLYAQIDTSTYRGKIDYLLQPLNPSLVTTGILYDRVEPWADLRDFGHRGGPDTSNMIHYWQARFELIGASYAGNQADSAALTNLIQQNAANLERKIIPIGGLLCQFQVLDTNAVNNHTLLFQDGLLARDESKSANGYLLTRQTFVSALLAGNVKPGVYQLKADAAFWFSNTSQTLSRYYVYENGQLLDSLAPSDSLSLNLNTVGTHSYFIIARMIGGQSYSSYSHIGVEATTESDQEWDHLDNDSYWYESPKFHPCGAVRSTSIVATIPFAGYAQGDPALLGRAEYSIYKRLEDENNCGIQTIRKPLIILDGFDPSDDRKAECLYGKYLRYLNAAGSNRYLGDTVRGFANQYDILILNFPKWTVPGNNLDTIYGGADYIERNAMVLVEFIKQINVALAANGSTEKLVIIGPSMGGLISRYALAYMEKNNMDHRCRTWISFDSPQQGANIAIGVQHFLKFFADNGVEEAKKAIDKQLGSTAAKQMLLVHHLGGETEAAPAPVFRTTFMNNLTNNGLPGSFGWPQNCRRIALVNGSMNGALFGENCDPGTKVDAFIEFKAWRLFNWLYRRVFYSVRGAYGKTYRIGGNTSCTVFAGMKAAGSVNNRTVSIKTPNSNTGLDAAPGGSIDIFGTLNGSETTVSHDPIGLGINLKPALIGIATNMNLAAGAIITALAALNDSPWNTLGGHSFGLGVRMNYETQNPDACFIPTKSALGYHWNTGLLGDWGEPLNNRQLYCSGEIPFHAYFGENANTEHVSLTKAKVDWVMDQLNIQASSQPNPNISIAGPSAMALGSTFTFSANYLPTGNSTGFFWEIIDVNGGVAPQMLGSANASSISIQLQGGTSTTGEGDFIVRLTSWYTNGSGEIVCYGTKERKVRTFKHRSLGFAPLCTNIKQYCSIKLTAGIPAGVTYLSSDWEISKFSNSDWSSSSAFEGNFTLSSLTCGSPSQVCKTLYFPNPMAGGNQFVLWFRIRTHLQIQNPNYGTIPGEEQYIDYVGPWNYYSHTYTVKNTVSCPPCIGGMVVGPNPAIKGTDTEVQVEISVPGLTYPTTGYIKDERGLVVDRFEVNSAVFTVPIARLEPAAYRLGIDGRAPADGSSGNQRADGNDGEALEAPFVVSKTGTDHMVISPNPLFREVDQKATVQIIDTQNDDTEFEITVDDLAGMRYLSFAATSREFDLDVSGLPIGSYVLTATGKNSSFQENLELTMKGEPYLWVSPNPAIDVLTAEMHNPLSPEPAFKVVLTDKLGSIEKQFETKENPFSVDVSTLTPDLYFIHVFDGVRQYSKMFRKL